MRAISPASSPTASDSSNVRPGASPFQNGTDGGAPCASSTRTRPGSTRLIRQEVVPSRNTSPARLSTAKSSSTVPDDFAVRLGDHLVIRGIRNRAAGGDGGQPRAAPAAHDAVHLIAMQIRAAAAALRGDALGQHLDDRVEMLAIQIAIRIRAAHQRVERRLPANRARRTRRRSAAPGYPGRFAGFPADPIGRANRAHQRRALDQLVARGGEEAALRLRAHPVPGPPDALQRHRDGARRSDLHTRSTEPISMPSSSDAVATTARSSPFFSRASAFRRKARERLP
jgi:hypothetical protein